MEALPYNSYSNPYSILLIWWDMEECTKLLALQPGHWYQYLFLMIYIPAAQGLEGSTNLGMAMRVKSMSMRFFMMKLVWNK